MTDFLKNCLLGKKLRKPVLVALDKCDHTFNYMEPLSNRNQVVYQSQMDDEGHLILQVSFTQTKTEVETLTRVAVFYKDVPVAGRDFYLMPSFFMFYSQPFKFFEDKQVKQEIGRVLDLYKASVDLFESIVKANHCKKAFFCREFEKITEEYHKSVYKSFSFEVIESSRIENDTFFSCQLKIELFEKEGKGSNKFLKFYSFQDVVYINQSVMYKDYDFEDYSKIKKYFQKDKKTFYGLDNAMKFESLMKSLSRAYILDAYLSSKAHNTLIVIDIKRRTIIVNVDFINNTVLVSFGNQFKISSYSHKEELADIFICSVLGFLASFDKEIFEIFGLTCEITPAHLSLLEMNFI